MQNSQLSSAVDRRRLTLLSDAVPGLVPVSTSDVGSVDGACGGGGHSMASIAFRLIGRIVSGHDENH
jgi:hypothetical protein